jgi:hypothetical protein
MQQRFVDFRSERCGDEQRYQNGGVISHRLPAAIQGKGVVLKQLDTLVKKQLLNSDKTQDARGRANPASKFRLKYRNPTPVSGFSKVGGGI